MVNLLNDTCVWLDVAKDPEQQATLGVPEQLVERGAVTLIVPTIVRDEFARNKASIIHESQIGNVAFRLFLNVRKKSFINLVTRSGKKLWLRCSRISMRSITGFPV